MSVRFDHLAVAAEDKRQSARFLTNLLGLPDPSASGPFLSVTLDDGVRLDYAEPGIAFPGQHYALLVSDDVFDHALERIKADGRQGADVGAARDQPEPAAGSLLPLRLSAATRY